MLRHSFKRFAAVNIRYNRTLIPKRLPIIGMHQYNMRLIQPVGFMMREFASTKDIIEEKLKSTDSILPGEEQILRIPPNINSWKLGKILDEDPLEIVKIIQEQTNEIITDEFQILSQDAIEIVCLEYE